MSGTDDSVSVEGIGGIDSTNVELSPGLTVLSGGNATNRTSLLKAINAALGGTRAIPRIGDDGGRVEMMIDGDEYYREVQPAGDGGVAYSGEPVTDASDIVDTYSTLNASNPIRQAIRQTDIDDTELRDLLMLPIDDESIQREIRELQRERQDVESGLDEIESRKERLPELESRKTELERELQEIEQELRDKREEIEDAEVAFDEADEARDLLDELEDAERELDRKNKRLSDASGTLVTSREELEDLYERKREIQGKLDSLSDVNESRLNELEDERNRLDGVVDLLSQAERAVRQISNSDQLPVELVDTDDNVLSELSEGNKVTCWACGSDVEESAFDEQAERLSSLASEYRSKMQEVEGAIEGVRESKQGRDRLQDNLREVKSRIRDREETVSHYEDRVERVEEEVEEQEERVEELRKEVEETEKLRAHPIVDLHEEARELSREQGQLERQLDDVTVEVGEIEQSLDEEDELQQRYEDLSSQIEDLKGRVERLEEDVVDRLQDHLDTLVDRLEYEEIERVRVDLRRYEDETGVNLSVVRDSGSGAVEDAYGLSSLSESERSMVGLAVALAAYETHEVSEKVPVLLLDSVEEFDADRVSLLIDYIMKRVPRVVVSLLPGDADPVDADRTVTVDHLA